MPYSPSEHFDASLISRGVMGAGDALGSGIADLEKKRKEAEAQMAGSMFGFQTLKKAGLIDPEEETKFLQGNANQRNAIVMASTPRLLEKFRTQQEQNEMAKAQMQRDLQLKIAQMHYGSNGSSGAQPPIIDPKTGMRWNGRQWVNPPASADAWARNVAVARGTGDAENFQGKDDGDMVKLRTPRGQTVVIPWETYQAMQPQSAAPQPTTPQTPATTLSAHDQQALAWAQSNPSDPRAAAILKKLGVQ